MEFKLLSFSERRRQRFQKQHVWHRWFAWRPIRIDSETLVWFKTIMRKRRFNTWNYSVQHSKYARLDDPAVKEGTPYP